METPAAAWIKKTSSANVTFTIIEVNDPPIVASELVGTIEEDGAPLTISFASLLENDSPGPGNESAQTLRIITVSAGTGGDVVIIETNVLFTPTSNFDGATNLRLYVEDNGLSAGVPDTKTADGLVSLLVEEVNDPPIASPVTLSEILEDSGTRTIPFDALIFNDLPGPTNESAQSITIIGVGAAVGGSVSLSGTNILFASAADFNGQASFRVYDPG